MSKLKTKQDILDRLRKANKDRKLIMANNAGFSTVEDFQKHLEEGIAKEPKLEKAKEPITIHNVHILDCSSSMGGIDYIGSKAWIAKNGIIDEVMKLSQQKKEGVKYVHSLITFSSPNCYKVQYWKESDPNFPSKVIQDLTALRDAVGKTLTRLINESLEGEKVIVKVFTDGEENRSIEFTDEMVSSLIENAKKHDITVAFVGTERDTQTAIKMFNVDVSNTLVHDNTTEGVGIAFNASLASTVTYATRAVKGEDTLTGFYKQQGTL